MRGADGKNSIESHCNGKSFTNIFANNLLDPRNKDSSLELILIKDQPDG